MTHSDRDAVIVDAIRTPSAKGRPGGGLASVHPVDLLARTFTELWRRNPGIDPGEVDDVLIGCVSQVGEQSATPGRMAWLGAGLPTHVPAVTIDRKCGSSQQAVQFAAQAIAAGSGDIYVAGGVESMSRVRMGSARMDADPYGDQVAERYEPGLVSQGVAAELVAAKWGISRDKLDRYSLRSHQLAAHTLEAGGFDREVFTVTTPEGPFSRDETIRPGSTLEKLGELDTVFRNETLSERFPEVEWAVTAGNSSQIVDGASTLLIMSAKKAAELGLTPRVRIHTTVAVGDDPLLMLTAPIPATKRALQKSGLTIDQMDHFEINEAFASVPLAWLAEFPEVDLARVNPRGGAIALGHPLGASGARLMTTMLHALEDTGGTYGLQLMCEAGGMANATIIERL